ncbi:hypothetical protein EMCRGX_G028848 [Ephydatia muelleri]
MAGTVWVGSLPSSFNETQLVNAFSKYGKVTSCVIHGGEYALVQLATAREAQRAADATQGVKIDGARVQMYCYEATTTSRARTRSESNSAYDRCNNVERWERYTDCYYFMQEQRCTRPAGKVCAYRHSDIAAASNDVCQKWLVKRCFDVSCPLRHPGKMEQGLLQCGSGGHLQFPRPRARGCGGSLMGSNSSFLSRDNEKGSPRQILKINEICSSTSPARSCDVASGGSGPHRREDNNCEVMEEWPKEEVGGEEEHEVKGSEKEVEPEEEVSGKEVEPEEEVSGKEVEPEVEVSEKEVEPEEEVSGKEVEPEAEVSGKEVEPEEEVGVEEEVVGGGKTSIVGTLKLMPLRGGRSQEGSEVRSEGSLDSAHLRSYMIECLQSFAAFRAPLDQYLKRLLISFNVAILEEDIHSMCGDVIGVIDLSSPIGGQVVLFHSFNPLATVILSTSAVASFQKKVVELLHTVPGHMIPLLDLLLLYCGHYGPLPYGQGGEETTPLRLLQNIPSIGWSGEDVSDLVLTIPTCPEASPSPVPLSSSTSLTELPGLQHSTQTWGSKDLVLRLADIQKPLTKDTYKEKFGKLLLWEENEQRLALRKKCGGTLSLVISSAGGEGRGTETCNAYLLLERGVVAFVSRVNSERVAVVVKQGSKVYGCHGTTLVLEDVLLNATLSLGTHPHSQDRLGVVFERSGVAKLLHCGFLERELTIPVRAKFFHNRSKFERLYQALESLSPALIARLLLPEEGDFPTVCPQPLPTEPCVELCSQDQRDALLLILSLPPNGPPLLVRGAFGTGKTFLLAAAIHCLMGKERGGGKGVRVLVCTPHHTTSQRFMKLVRTVGSLSEDVCTLQLVSGSAEGEGQRGVVTALQLRRDLGRVLDCSSLLLVTSYLCSSHLARMIPSEFFSHVLLDGCGQVVEPEGVVPLSLVGPSTRVVMTGDQSKVSRGVAGTYDITLITSHSSHPHSHNGPGPTHKGNPAHKNCTLQPSSSHFPTYSLMFVCSSVDQVIPGEDEGVLGREASVVADVVKRYMEQWPGDWGELDHSKVCIASPWPLQLAALVKENGFIAGISKKLISDLLQDQQFRMLFVSTSESIRVGPDGSVNPSNPTKSICDLFVFNTVMTRAQSLVVSVGNPFLLLRLEQSMVKKYGDRGSYWSHYIKACLDHDTIQLHHSLKAPAEWRGDLAAAVKIIPSQP